MPTPAYLTIKGTTQGLISAGALSELSVGNAIEEAHEDEILVQAFSHQIYVPRDLQTNQITGQPVHKPLMITKAFDKSSPLIFEALTNRERLEFCHLDWYRTSREGQQEVYFSIRLEEALIVDVQSKMPHYLDPNTAHLTNLEDVYISYQRIIWEHVTSQTSGEDDLRTRNSR